MKTPIEKASAVRSGGSSIASRRRNVVRNIIIGRRFSRMNADQIRVHPRKSAAIIFLTKALQCFCFILERIEDRKQFSDHQQVLNSIRQVQQFELATLPAEGRVVGNQLAYATRIHVLDAREIE